MIYLDHAATTPVLREAADVMYRVLTEYYGNPSAQYSLGLTMKKRVEEWRRTIALALGCPAERFYFTSCGTEGDNWAVYAACWKNRHVGRHIVTDAVEHSAVLEACRRMEEAGWEVTRLAPGKYGELSADAVLDAVRPDTALVSLMLVNNELGNRYPIETIARGLPSRNARTLLHTDAVQGFLKTPFTVKYLGADAVTVSAHKIGGPKGIGGVYFGERFGTPRPFLSGGGQERGARSGTEATAQIAGFAEAARIRSRAFQDNYTRLTRLRQYALERLTEIPELTALGPAADASGGTAHAPHILGVSLAGWPGANVVNDLSKKGICISTGSACGRGKPSHVARALDLPPRVREGVLRLSFGPETTEADIDACADALRRHVSERLPML